MTHSWIDAQRIADLRARVEYLEAIVASQSAEMAEMRAERVSLRNMLDAAHRALSVPLRQDDRRHRGLSPRQREILQAIAEGYATDASLVEWLGMWPAELADSLRRLERRDLVRDVAGRWILI